MHAFTRSGEILKCADQTANVKHGVQNCRVFHVLNSYFLSLKTYKQNQILQTGMCQFSA